MNTVRSLTDLIGQNVQVSAGRVEAHHVMPGTLQGVDADGIILHTVFAPGDDQVLMPRARFIPWSNILEVSGDTQVEPVSLV